MSKSIESIMIEQLEERGLFRDQAAEIMAGVKARPDDPMRGRWGEAPEAYPEAMIPIAWLAVKSAALDWIIRNKPRHWARPLFE